MRTLIFRASFIALALTAALAASASAAPSTGVNIGVAPSKLQLRLVPGRTAHTVIRVYNKGDRAVSLDVFPQDYSIDAQSTVNFVSPGTLPGSAAPWTTLSAKLLRVPAHSSRALGVTIKVPRNIPPGTHTLAVIFRSRTLSTGAGVRYRPAVASLMAAGVTTAGGGGLVFRGAAVVRSVDVHWKSLSSVRSPSDLWDALFHPTVTAQVAVINHGNTFFNILKGSTTFSSGLAVGGSGTDVKAPHYTILPGTVRYVEAAWSDPPFIGWTHLQTHLFYNDSSALSFDSPANVVIIPWNLLVLLGWAAVVVAVLWVVRARRRRSAVDPARRVVWADSK